MIYVVRYLLIVVYTIIIGAIAAPAGLVNPDWVVWLGRVWVGWILRTCGVRVVAEGLENVPADHPTVFMSNHSSVFDTAAIIQTLPFNWRFVAKRELTRIPFFGWALVTGQHIIIERGNHASAVSSLRKAAAQVSSGTNVIIFPEGTRSESGELGKFKSGGFHLAIQSGVPIVPISVSGSQAITPKGSLKIIGGTIRIVYGKPISTEGMKSTDRAALKSEVRQAILQGLAPSGSTASAAASDLRR